MPESVVVALDEVRFLGVVATGKWGIRGNRVEIKAIDPPRTIKDAVEKQMRAERDKRAEILEPREEEPAQLTRDVQTLLARTADQQAKTILARYVRWHLMPLAHQRTERDSGFTRYQREHLRRKLDAARLLLSDLRARGISLAALTQPVVDRWLIRHRPRQRYARPFLLWAATNSLAPAHVAIGTSAHTGDREIMGDTDRVLLAVKLETDDTLALVDRVAGCLVLQYRQSCWRLVNLTADDVLAHPDEPGVLGLQLGRDPCGYGPGCPRSCTSWSTTAGRSRVRCCTARLPTCSPGCAPTGR